MTRSRLYIYILAGGYLAYTGFGLAKSALEQRPENFMLYLAAGIVFVVIGGFLAVKSIQKLIKNEYIDSSAGGFDDGTREDTGEERKKEIKEEIEHEDRNGI